jgi:hypothetical protein
VLGDRYVDDAYVYRSIVRAAAIASQDVLGSPTITQSPPPERSRRRPKPTRKGTSNRLERASCEHDDGQ